MLSMMLPMIVLYEVSILWASLLDRRAERRRAREGVASGDTAADGDAQS
jgi:Sec-independent protein secretion pathway component TatC